MNYGKSFEQWCIENNRQDVLDRWDYELNKCSPKDVSYCTNKKYYFTCPRKLHKSELKQIRNFTMGQEGSIKCHLCNSFAQWGLDNIGQDFLIKYWDYDNNKGIDPWNIKHSSTTKIYIKCQNKDYHGSYLMSCCNFVIGKRCPYCATFHGLVHPKDSFAQYHIDHTDKNFIEKYWSNKNILNPWEITIRSIQKIYIKCQEKDYHEDYLTTPDKFFLGCRCPYCSNHHGLVHIRDSLGTVYPKSLEYWSEKNKKSPYKFCPMSHENVYWKCPNKKHKDYKRIISSSVKYDFRCPMCQKEEHRGENIGTWEGGITTLNNYLRNVIAPWRIDSLKYYNYICDVSGVHSNLIVHHVYNFKNIVQETLKITKLPVYQHISQYSILELYNLATVCLELHYKHGLGICLNKDIHRLFHSIYGERNNTIEQYNEFKYQYNNGLAEIADKM